MVRIAVKLLTKYIRIKTPSTPITNAKIEAFVTEISPCGIGLLSVLAISASASLSII